MGTQHLGSAMKKRSIALVWLAVAAWFSEPVAAGTVPLSTEVANLTAAAKLFHAAYSAEAAVERKLRSIWLDSPQHVAIATEAQTADDEYEKAFADHSHATPEQRTAAHNRLIAARNRLEDADRNWFVDAQPAYRLATAQTDAALRSWSAAAKALADDPLRGGLKVSEDTVPAGFEVLTTPPVPQAADTVPPPQPQQEKSSPVPPASLPLPPVVTAPSTPAAASPASVLPADDEQWRATQHAIYQGAVDNATKQLKGVETSRVPWNYAGTRWGREWGDEKRATIKSGNAQIQNLTARLEGFNHLPAADIIRLHRELIEGQRQADAAFYDEIRKDFPTVEQAGQTVCRLVPNLESLRFKKDLNGIHTWWQGTCVCKDGVVRAADVQIGFTTIEVGPHRERRIGYYPNRVLVTVGRGDSQVVQLPSLGDRNLGLIWRGGVDFAVGDVPIDP